MTSRGETRVADGGFVVGGALMLASAALPWARRGAGSTLHGHALIDTIAAVGHQHGYGGATALLAIAWYAIPACGALAWVVVGFGDVNRTSGRAAAALATVVTATMTVFFAIKVGTRSGAGVYAGAIGALTLAVASWHARRPKGPRRAKRVGRFEGSSPPSAGEAKSYVRGTSRSS